MLEVLAQVRHEMLDRARQTARGSLLGVCEGTSKLVTLLVVTQTKVTLKFIEEFARAVPGCRIEHDGGIIEPKK